MQAKVRGMSGQPASLLTRMGICKSEISNSAYIKFPERLHRCF